MSFKTTVTFLLDKLHSNTWLTLLLRDAEGYVGCLNRVSTDEFNILLKKKGNSLVTVTHGCGHVTTVQNIPIGY